MTTTPTPGRRRAAPAPRRRNPAALLVVLLPLAAVLLALLVDPDPAPAPATAPPESQPVTTSVVVCPSAPGPDDSGEQGGSAAVASLTGEAGDVDVAVDGGEETPTELDADAAADVDAGDGWFAATGREALAPLLLAGRFAGPAAADCREPVFDQWFTGVGAGPTHGSVLELLNPDRGRAVVDVEVLGRDGPVDAPDLLGLAVLGRESVRVDLAATLPRSDLLALRVRVVRGRVSSHLADRDDPIGSAAASTDWLAGQAAPATTHRLLGLPEGEGRRTLVLANPGDDEGSATVRLVTARSTFAPEGVAAVRLPPRSVTPVDVGRVVAAALRGRAVDRALAVEVETSVPTTAGLFQVVDDDLVPAAAPPALDGLAGAILPPGPKRLALAGATGPGTVTVTAYGARGRPLEDEQRVELDRGRGAAVDLPAATRLVSIDPDGTGAQAAVLAGDRTGWAVLGVRRPVDRRLVPDVRPG